MEDLKKQNDGSVPKHVLNELLEYTVGGFLLFYFNSETGHPEHAMTFDSPAHCLALQKYMADWTEGVKLASVETIKNQIQLLAMENVEEESGEEEEI